MVLKSTVRLINNNKNKLNSKKKKNCLFQPIPNTTLNQYILNSAIFSYTSYYGNKLMITSLKPLAFWHRPNLFTFCGLLHF